MSGETEKEQTAWTTDTLRYALTKQIETEASHIRELLNERDRRHEQHLIDTDKRYEQRWEAAQQAVAAALAEREKAAIKAQQDNEAWRAQANEWRGQSADRERTQQEQVRELTATFIPRHEVQAMFAGLADKVEDLKTYRDQAGGGARQRQQSMGVVVASTAVVGLLVSIVVVVVNVLLAR